MESMHTNWCRLNQKKYNKYLACGEEWYFCDWMSRCKRWRPYDASSDSSDEAKWEVVYVDANTINLKNEESGLYLCANPDGKLDCDRSNARSWERFDRNLFETKSGGHYHVKTKAHGGKYLSGDANGNWRIDTQGRVSLEEEFIITKGYSNSLRI